MKRRTRFAPSPTGLLHIGNAYSALICQQWAKQHNAELLLRIEDIDHTRCRPEFEQQLINDLHWLGLRFDGEIVRQSQRHDLYRAALEQLREMEVIYPCFCTRKKIQEEIARMGSAPHHSEMNDHYPGICRTVSRHQASERMEHEQFAWRIDMAKALDIVNKPIGWHDERGHFHAAEATLHSDTVIGRKDIDFSYHLAVATDDAEQKITHIIRGEDLIDSTPIHALLQKLLNLPSPIYLHHPLLLDERGERLAKRNNSTTLKSLRGAGITADSLRHFLMDNDSLCWPFESDNLNSIREALGSID